MSRPGRDLGAAEAPLREKWSIKADTLKRREDANAAFNLTKRRALWHAAHRSRRAAIETGSPRYIGTICKRNPAHGGERYVSGGGCVECARIGRDRYRRLHGAPVIGPRPKARHSLRSGRRQAARRRRSEERPTVRPLLGLLIGCSIKSKKENCC